MHIAQTNSGSKRLYDGIIRYTLYTYKHVRDVSDVYIFIRIHLNIYYKYIFIHINITHYGHNVYRKNRFEIRILTFGCGPCKICCRRQRLRRRWWYAGQHERNVPQTAFIIFM
jgi:hypothetical protein